MQHFMHLMQSEPRQRQLAMPRDASNASWCHRQMADDLVE